MYPQDSLIFHLLPFAYFALSIFVMNYASTEMLGIEINELFNFEDFGGRLFWFIFCVFNFFVAIKWWTAVDFRKLMRARR
jgi:hypothetical protein